MTFDGLISWSRDCHLVAMNKMERALLGDALTADDSRNCVEQALQALSTNSGLPDRWNLGSIVQLRRELRKIEKANSLGLPTVVTAIIVTEQFHEAVLCAFHLLQWWGTQNSSKRIDALFSEQFTKQAIERCRETASALGKFSETSEASFLLDTINGFAGFAKAVEYAREGMSVVEEILRRHHQVQSGKFDGGVAKSDWITMENGRVLRPSPIFQRMEPPFAADGKELTHPYRLEPFIHMLRENKKLSQENKRPRR